MNVQELKEQARRHEQKEEWQKAFDLYSTALRVQDKEEPPDITLFNRVGDIQTRLGQIDGAVEKYEKAIEMYMAAELPNNAIAICKKVLRNLPDRSIFFLRMGQIRGRQGFLTDARQNFLAYAERQTAVGDVEGALNALVEFVDISPEDVEIRRGLALQLESHGRVEDAAGQYLEIYRRLILLEKDDEALTISEKLEELDPDLDLPEPEAIREEAANQETDELVLESTSLGGLELEDSRDGGDTSPKGREAEVRASQEAGVEEAGRAEAGIGEEPQGFPAFQLEEEEDGESDVEENPLPLLTVDDEDDVGSVPLPEAEEEEAVEAAQEDAAFERTREDLEPPETIDEEPSSELVPDTGVDHLGAAASGDMVLAVDRVKTSIESDENNVELHQRLVEYAFRTNDQEVLISAYLALAGCLSRTGAPRKAKAVFQQVLSLSPGHEEATSGLRALQGTTDGLEPTQVASSEEYVDLGSMILGDEAEKTTRWQVAAETPTGDDEADFAKMLGQFKEKVSEHVAADDVGAHHDLGTAYMEMGLYDEAVGEFQMALRASPGHLPTHEVMGRCWMELNKPEMAVRALARALDSPYEVEDELIGIYYLMGRAQEDRGNTTEALEFYEKVFSLDINFGDVTERLRALR